MRLTITQAANASGVAQAARCWVYTDENRGLAPKAADTDENRGLAPKAANNYASGGVQAAR